jgi:hypothetical protein
VSIHMPRALLWAIATSVVVAAFVVGAWLTRAGVKRSRLSVLDARRSEQQLARARHELAAIEQAIADRTIKYAQVGNRLREASAMLRLTEEQTTSVRKTIELAVNRTKRAWWLSLFAFSAGIAFNYFVNWTSNAWVAEIAADGHRVAADDDVRGVVGPLDFRVQAHMVYFLCLGSVVSA